MNIAEMSKLHDWVQALQPGDEVLASRRKGYTRMPSTIQKVAKLTATQVVLDDGRRYERARSVGRLIESGWYGEIQPVTQQHRDEIEQKELQQWLNGLAQGSGAWDRLQPLHVLRALKSAHDKATDPGPVRE